MKLPPIMDADDVGMIGRFAVIASLAGVTMIGASAVFGLAWTVFRLAGGL